VIRSGSNSLSWDRTKGMRSSDEDRLYCKVTGFVAESIFMMGMNQDLWPEDLEM